ncbi:MAG: 6-carboxytetrahydropterin synthase [Bacteroidetes bacterium]|nr:6-carboxytetrahydropterin synthase [Bacteroidota bacterium]
MSKIRLTKAFPFEMAHALYGYDGACKNIHGHSYMMHVTIIGKPLNDDSHVKNGMVMDFSDLKEIVKKKIVDEVDHALVLNGNSPHRNLLNLDDNFEKIVYVPYQPTCENLLIDFKNRIVSMLPETVKLHSMRLSETASSYAEWFSEDNKN